MPKRPKVSGLESLQTRLDYRFQHPALLQRSVTHRSSDEEHMERLEFLGDAVLGLVMAEHLHSRFEQLAEGSLSRMRAALVCKDSLGRIAADWELERYLRVGDGEWTPEGKLRSPSIAANAVEAIVGAVFEDSGWSAARALVLRAWASSLASLTVEDMRDAKTRLQELTQARGWGLPLYEVSDFGAGASPRFEAICNVKGETLGRGRGERKKLAELAAAEQAWDRLNV